MTCRILARAPCRAVSAKKVSWRLARGVRSHDEVEPRGRDTEPVVVGPSLLQKVTVEVRCKRHFMRHAGGRQVADHRDSRDGARATATGACSQIAAGGCGALSIRRLRQRRLPATATGDDRRAPCLIVDRDCEPRPPLVHGVGHSGGDGNEVVLKTRPRVLVGARAVGEDRNRSRRVIPFDVVYPPAVVLPQVGIEGDGAARVARQLL